jgi:hypothetical protein
MGHRKRRRSRGAADLEKLKNQLLAEDALKGRQIVFQSNEEKMSEVLLEFIEPFEDLTTTSEAYRKLIALAVIAWNAALLKGADRQNLIVESTKTILAMAGEEWRQDLNNILAMLVERKERYFAHNKRFIIDYRLSETKKSYHLSVISTL